MVFVQKWPFFETFFFRQYRPGKCLFRYFTTKKRLSRLLIQKLQKVEKLTFFHFFSKLLFLGNIGQENVFHYILEQKKAFLGYKNKKFKKSKNWHFSKGVNPWFFSKNGHFSKVFFLINIGKQNVFYDILHRKNFFLGYKMSFTIF